ncbi:hypothetical protein [Hyphococcus sp.]|uniref:hypothetical protein n=1 Tax=Hyphococcus sp. TaxID=2038636 RepID=UPI0035C669CE
MKNKGSLLAALCALGVTAAIARLPIWAENPTIEDRIEAAWPVENDATTEKESFDGKISPEAANELRAALISDEKPAETPPPVKPAPDKPKPDYDAAIKAAMEAGNPIKAAILKSCKRVPSGGTVKLAPSSAALMRQYCKDRDFEIEVDRSGIRPGAFAASGPAPAPAEQSEAAQPDPELLACRKEARKHIISCAKVTDYQNCETWGCPEIIECDRRLTRCDDHGSPYNQSGEFYCDTRNWRTRDFDYEKVVARACPVQ